jgi:phosphoglycerate dehydrogenase-like enzyme
MQVWSNTNTLDGYIPTISLIADKSAAEIALVGGKTIHLNEFPRLRGIFKTGVGRDNVPEDEARARRIVCAFPSAETCGIIYEETANFTCNLIFKCLYSDVGDFAAWKKLDRPSLKEQQLLVIGAGKIGSRVAAKMRSFLEVTTFDALTNNPEELESLVRMADCISLHIPLTSETRTFFDARKLSWMKAGASLVNTARGPVVEEDALFDELSKGRLRAAFDVFWEEPYKGKLMKLPAERFIVSPHVASTCREFLTATAEDFRKFLEGLKRI